MQGFSEGAAKRKWHGTKDWGTEKKRDVYKCRIKENANI